MTEPQPEKPAPDFDALRSLTRLLVGGAIEGADELVQRLRQWEQAARPPADIIMPAPDETGEERLRYTLVGLVFEAEDQARSGLGTLERASDRALGVLARTLRPVTDSRLARPVRRRVDAAIVRGESEVRRWARVGRLEETHGRAMARQVVSGTADELIEHLAQNPEVRDLVQEQSMGVAAEVMDEMREQTVTADTLAERLVRNLLRRTPREELPEPPATVQDQATYTRRVPGRESE